MTTITRAPRRRSTKLLALAAGLTLAGGVLTAAGPADAFNPNDLVVLYDTVGTTHVQRSNFDVALRTSVITTDIRPTGAFTADLPIPTSHVRLKAFGYLPAAADVSFVQVSPATGALTSRPDGQSSVAATARYVVQLHNVVVGGKPADVGDFCQTISPVTLALSTPSDGPGFNVTEGGTITGTYTIGNFKNCNTSTDLTNIIVPGPGNTVSVTLSNGRVATAGSALAERHSAAISRASS